MKTIARQMSLFFLMTTALLSTALKAGEWSGRGDIGYNSVSGNADSDSLALGLNAGYNTKSWAHTGDIDAYSASQNGTTSAKTYSLKLQSDFDLGKKFFAFGNIRYLDDRFSGYEYQSSVSLGAGRTFLEDGNDLFSGQIGLGYRKSEPTGNPGNEDEPVVTAQMTYNRGLTETTVFESKWNAEAGSDNAYLEGGIAVIVAMTDTLGIKLSQVVKHNTDVPAGTKNTDRHTTVSLNYRFK